MQTEDGTGEGAATVVVRLRRSTGYQKPSLPRVRVPCALVTRVIASGAEATVRPVVRPTPLVAT